MVKESVYREVHNKMNPFIKYYEDNGFDFYRNFEFLHQFFRETKVYLNGDKAWTTTHRMIWMGRNG